MIAKERRRLPKGSVCSFLLSNPQATSRLDLEEELRSVESEIRGARFRDSLIMTAAHAVRPDDLVRLLREEQPKIVTSAAMAYRTG